MAWASVDIQHKRFRTRWMGLDPQEVEIFFQQMAEEIQGLKVENASLRKDVQDQQRELKEYKEREKTIRNVLLNVQKTAEQIKANAEKEARLIVAEAEINSEKIVRGAHERLVQLHEDITGLKRHRVQLEAKLRSILEAYQQLLDMEKEDERDNELEEKVKFLAARAGRKNGEENDH